MRTCKYILLKPLLPVLVLFFGVSLRGQDVSLALQKKAPLDAAENLAMWQKLDEPVQVSFLNSNERYIQDRVPVTKAKQTDTLVAWRGEKVHTQLAIWTKNDLQGVTISVSDLVLKSGKKISKKNAYPGFIGYVKTDEFGNGCGHRQPKDFDSSLVADPINSLATSLSVTKQTVQPVWISIQVPATTDPGTYTGTVTLQAAKSYRLKLTIKVLDRVLPPPSQWHFTLDLWQHPAAIARVHNVPLWSEAHFAFMKKYYTMLAAAGQKNSTASIVEEPWNHQTYDDYPGLIR